MNFELISLEKVCYPVRLVVSGVPKSIHFHANGVFVVPPSFSDVLCMSDLPKLYRFAQGYCAHSCTSWNGETRKLNEKRSKSTENIERRDNCVHSPKFGCVWTDVLQHSDITYSNLHLEEKRLRHDLL